MGDKEATEKLVALLKIYKMVNKKGTAQTLGLVASDGRLNTKTQHKMCMCMKTYLHTFNLNKEN